MTFLSFLRTREPAIFLEAALWLICAINLALLAFFFFRTRPLLALTFLLAGTLSLNQLLTEFLDLRKAYKEEAADNQEGPTK